MELYFPNKRQQVPQEVNHILMKSTPLNSPMP